MIRNYFATVALLVALTIGLKAQNISVAPSRFYYKVNPGGIKSQVLKVTNNSNTKESFVVSFGDFSAPGSAGKSLLMKAGESQNSLTKYVSANPAYFELEPGKSQDVQVILEMPNLPESNKVKWGTLILKIDKEKTKPGGLGKNDVGMGILETFQFVVHIFQTPPNVTLKQAEIISLKSAAGDKPGERAVSMLTKNIGEAILDCAAYIELVNLGTGKKERMKPSGFTILPGGSREMTFMLPADIEKGKYNITGVVDFGSKDEVAAAELELDIN